MRNGLIIALLLLPLTRLFAQVDYTANDIVKPYTGLFYYGSNMGWYPPWSDKTLADIAAGNAQKGIQGVGIKSLRPAIPGWYLEERGYLSLLSPFKHYQKLGIRENTVFIGYPIPEHQDSTFYTQKWDEPSALYKNIYEPIWDGGKHGTPINEENYFANYVYKTVRIYKPYVKFWEIWNEPDFEEGKFGNLKRGEKGNWWENDPIPEQLPRLRAPLYHYIRCLRISYEVIKTVDPNAYVAIGGIGYESYLDAILRNSDNPDSGKFTADYPVSGGAYFDVLSYHLYPQFEPAIRTKKNRFWFWNEFVYNRHSDAAARTIVDKKYRFEKVLNKYGYNGLQYPKKELIITEINIPRVPHGEELGGLEVQRNFITKALITCQKHNIRQMYLFGIGDGHEGNGETDGYASMGLYHALKDVEPYKQTIHEAGIAFKTTSDLLLGSRYDPVRTRQLHLPDSIEGGAFLGKNGNYTYVLWAKTRIDQDEDAFAHYQFSREFEINQIDIYDWKGNKRTRSLDNLADALLLTGSPLFIRSLNKENVNPYHSLCIQIKNQWLLKLLLMQKDCLFVSIYDSEGHEVKNISAKNFNRVGDVQIALDSALVAGIYFVEIAGKRGVSRKKIVIG